MLSRLHEADIFSKKYEFPLYFLDISITNYICMVYRVFHLRELKWFEIKQQGHNYVSR